MSRNNKNYSQDKNTEENRNIEDKYSITGESAFSRDSTIPYDDDEVLSERHFNLRPLENRFGDNFQDSGRVKSAFMDEDHSGKGPRGYKRTDDKIKEDVCDALYRNPAVDASDMDVSVSNGIVKLSGFVSGREQKKLAERSIEDISGIEDIYNDLSISRGPNKNPPRGLIDNITGLN